MEIEYDIIEGKVRGRREGRGKEETEHGQTGTATQHDGWHPQAAIEDPSECEDFKYFESKARGDRSGDRIV